MSTPCPKCSGPMEQCVLSGVVSLKRRRAAMASGRVSALRAEVCVSCGFTELYAERTDRLFRDVHREGGG